MEPEAATCHRATASRPAAVPVLTPLRFGGDSQPVLPWTVVAEVIEPDSPLDPRLRQVGTAVMAAVVEVISGQRQPLQLERWLEPDLLVLLDNLRNSRCGEGLRLHSVRVQSPRPDVLEVSAHLRQGTASRAAALRLTRRRGQWLATHLSIALRPNVVNRAGWISPLVG